MTIPVRLTWESSAVVNRWRRLTARENQVAWELGNGQPRSQGNFESDFAQ